MKRNRILFLLLLVHSMYFVSAVAAPRPVEIVAHRGLKKFAPENTLPAIQKAIDLGIDYVEIDVRETKDGEFVMMHNSTVDVTTNGTGEISTMTVDQIRSLDAGAKFGEQFKGTKVPLFKEALAMMKGKIKGYIDFKSGSPEKLVKVLEEAGMTGDVVIYDDPKTLMEIEKLNKDILLMPGVDNVNELKVMQTSMKLRCLETSINIATKDFIKEAHKEGIKVFMDILGPLDMRSGMLKAMKMGADVIQTDNADQLVEIINKKK